MHLVHAAAACSRRSAMTRSASAFARISAAALVYPYTNTPGSAGTSATHRPSSSCSLSIFSMVHGSVQMSVNCAMRIWPGCRKRFPEYTPHLTAWHQPAGLEGRARAADPYRCQACRQRSPAHKRFPWPKWPIQKSATWRVPLTARLKTLPRATSVGWSWPQPGTICRDRYHKCALYP